MMNLKITDHARTRLPQRNIKEEDVAIILNLGTETRDGVVMTNSDVRGAVEPLKRQIERIERLTNTYLVTDGEVLITAYRPGRRKLKRVMHSARGTM